MHLTRTPRAGRPPRNVDHLLFTEWKIEAREESEIPRSPIPGPVHRGVIRNALELELANEIRGVFVLVNERAKVKRFYARTSSSAEAFVASAL